MASLSLFSDAFGLRASTGLAATGTKLPELTCVTVASSRMEGSWSSTFSFSFSLGGFSSVLRQAESSVMVFSSSHWFPTFLHLAAPCCTIFKISGSFHGPLSDFIQPP
uniref:Uncharacterized protein n=1 Tax=Opuntia streptacantha TaxID=393608 RepID=A0A7C9DW84_OPUST